MVKKFNRLILVILLAVLAGSIALYAQSSTATMVGDITDPSGASVVGATITVTSEVALPPEVRQTVKTLFTVR